MYCDIPSRCRECIFCHYEGEIMVGDQLGGGPEEAYSCKKNMNMTFFLFRPGAQCDHWDDGAGVYSPYYSDDDDSGEWPEDDIEI